MKRSVRTPEERTSTRSDEFYYYGVSNKLKRTKMERKFVRPLSNLAFMRPTENKSKERLNKNLQGNKNKRNYKQNNSVNNASSREKIDDQNDFLEFDEGDLRPAPNENLGSIQDKSLRDASTMTDHQCCSWVPASVYKILDEKQDLLFGKIQTLVENSIIQKLLEAETKTGVVVSNILQEKQDLLVRKIETLIENSISKKSTTGNIDDSPTFSFDHIQSGEACVPVGERCTDPVEELAHSSEAIGPVVDKPGSVTVEEENGLIEELAHSLEAIGPVVDKLSFETAEEKTYSSDEDYILDEAINEIVVKFPFVEIYEAQDLNSKLQEPTFFANMDKYVSTTGGGAKATLEMFNHIFSKKLQGQFTWDNSGTTIQSFPYILALIHSAGRKVHKKLEYEEKATNEMIKNALRNARAKKK